MSKKEIQRDKNGKFTSDAPEPLEMIGFRMEAQKVNAIAVLAQKEDTTVSEWCRKVIEEKLSTLGILPLS